MWLGGSVKGLDKPRILNPWTNHAFKRNGKGGFFQCQPKRRRQLWLLLVCLMIIIIQSFVQDGPLELATHNLKEWSEGMFYSYSTLDDVDFTLLHSTPLCLLSPTLLSRCSPVSFVSNTRENQSVSYRWIFQSNSCPVPIPSSFTNGIPKVQPQNVSQDPLQMMLM